MQWSVIIIDDDDNNDDSDDDGYDEIKKLYYAK